MVREVSSVPRAARSAGAADRSAFYSAAALDLALVLLFAILGRSSHGEANDVRGLLHTAGPFLVGALLGQGLSRSWRRPVSLTTGVVVWLCTVTVGVALRLAGGDTARLPFVIVATVTLALLLVGWRLLYALVRLRRSPRRSVRR